MDSGSFHLIAPSSPKTLSSSVWKLSCLHVLFKLEERRRKEVRGKQFPLRLVVQITTAHIPLVKNIII